MEELAMQLRDPKYAEELSHKLSGLADVAESVEQMLVEGRPAPEAGLYIVSCYHHQAGQAEGRIFANYSEAERYYHSLGWRRPARLYGRQGEVLREREGTSPEASKILDDW